MDTNNISKIICISGSKILFLFSKRLKKWHLPGGHLQQDEDFETGLKREVKEETNCELDRFQIISKHNNVALFVGNLENNNIILSEEHSKYRWLTPYTALKIKLCKFTRADVKFYINLTLSPNS